MAIKDNVVYVSTFTGQVYLLNIANPAAPQQIDVLGLDVMAPSARHYGHRRRARYNPGMRRETRS
jgi:hypothetical protein